MTISGPRVTNSIKLTRMGILFELSSRQEKPDFASKPGSKEIDLLSQQLKMLRRIIFYFDLIVPIKTSTTGSGQEAFN